jgi:hypothetical protein
MSLRSHIEKVLTEDNTLEGRIHEILWTIRAEMQLLKEEIEAADGLMNPQYGEIVHMIDRKIKGI